MALVRRIRIAILGENKDQHGKVVDCERSQGPSETNTPKNVETTLG